MILRPGLRHLSSEMVGSLAIRLPIACQIFLVSIGDPLSTWTMPPELQSGGGGLVGDSLGTPRQIFLDLMGDLSSIRSPDYVTRATS